MKEAGKQKRASYWASPVWSGSLYPVAAAVVVVVAGTAKPVSIAVTGAATGAAAVRGHVLLGCTLGGKR